jgi:hypothetical protein
MKKSKKKKLVIKAEREHKFNNVSLFKLGDSLWWQNKHKKLSSEFITQVKRSMVEWLTLDTETGQVHLNINITTKELKKFLKEIEKSERYFKQFDKKRKKEKKPVLNKVFFRHLNPELSFAITYK